MVESKWFRGFDWFYRLLIINLITIVIPVALAIGPLLIYYNKEFYVFLIIGLAFAAFAFIPCITTSFFMIKHYKEEKAGNVFILYFKNLWIVFKNIYLYELIVIPFGFAFLYGSIHYWSLLGPENFTGFDIWGIIIIFGFIISFFCLCALVFSLVNIPMIVSYFRMKTFDLFKFSFYIAFRYFFRTFLYLLIFFGPIYLAIWAPSIFLPFYALFGISSPLFLIYFLSRKFFWYLCRNIDDVKDMEKYDFKGEENETRN